MEQQQHELSIRRYCSPHNTSGLLFSTLRVGSAVVKQDDFDVSDLPGKACEDLERQAMREIAQSKLTEASQPAALRAD